MGSIGKRIFELERLIAETDKPTGLRPQVAAILNEFAALKQSYAHGLRGGVPIVPKRIPSQILGEGFTTGDVVRLAVERASESGAFPEEEIPKWTAAALQLFGRRRDLGAVVEWGQAHGI